MDAALHVLDARGLKAVSTRAVAQQLGVRMNTVLWHVKTKARLIDLMADRVVSHASLEHLPESGMPRVEELTRRYRQALLTHRDGAALVSGTYPAEPHTLTFAEALIEALVAAGMTDREAVWTCWSLVYFTLGVTQEQQALAGADPDRLDAALVEGAHPTLSRVMPYLLQGSFEERFEFGLALLLKLRP